MPLTPNPAQRTVRALVAALTMLLVSGCAGSGGDNRPSAIPSAPTVSPASDPTVIVEPEAGYQHFYDLIGSATTSVDMVMYALQDPAADAALITAARRGVTVRVLLNADPDGGGGPAVNQDAFDDLDANGVDVAWAWPGTLWHQKSILVDDAVVAIMSANLVAQDYPVVRDFAVVTRDPATVAGMAATFDADFAKTTVAPTPGEAPRGSNLVWSPGAEAALVSLIEAARAGTTINVETEQLDSAPLEQALIAAVARGVQVDLTMTVDPANTAGLNTLKAGGVAVRLYPKDARIYIHAKAMSVNGDTVFVGSTNLTSAMTDANRNVGIVTTDPAAVRAVIDTLQADFAGATPY